MLCYSDPVVANHCVLFWASGCESCCYSEPVGVNRGGLCWPRGCESWWVMMSKWLWIMLCYDELVVLHEDEICWASGCESWYTILSQWMWILVCNSQPVVVNQGISCEKSRFYAKKSYCFPILGGARAGCAPPCIRPWCVTMPSWSSPLKCKVSL